MKLLVEVTKTNIAKTNLCRRDECANVKYFSKSNVLAPSHSLDYTIFKFPMKGGGEALFMTERIPKWEWQALLLAVLLNDLTSSQR